MDIGTEFFAQTKQAAQGSTGKQQGLPQPPLEEPWDAANMIALPAPSVAQQGPVNFRALAERRRSVRTYRPEPLALADLAYLLWCTQGVQQLMPGVKTVRTVPSAGGCHAFETYLLANAVVGLEPGLYRYAASAHSLVEHTKNQDVVAALVEAFRNIQLVQHSAVVALWVAVAQRQSWRFGARGYRYLLLDAGHVCQNWYLAAESINCGACALGSFDDDGVNTAMGFDGVERFIVYAATAGKKC